MVQFLFGCTLDLKKEKVLQTKMLLNQFQRKEKKGKKKIFKNIPKLRNFCKKSYKIKKIYINSLKQPPLQKKRR